MPRCRTAWMTALFNALGVRTVHDVYLTNPQWHQEDSDFGIIDPSVALMFPQHHCIIKKRYCVYANSMVDRLDALDAWSDTPLSQQTRDLYEHNFFKYMLECGYGRTFHVNELNDDDFVADLYSRCTSQPADKGIIQTFQLLKIEEHYPKARALLDKQRG